MTPKTAPRWANMASRHCRLTSGLKTGLDAVAERLKVAGDGKPRLYIVRDATIGQDTRLAELRRPVSTEKEFPGYVWPETKAGRAADEVPVKTDDHGMDAMRYLVMYLDGGGGIPTAGVSSYAQRNFSTPQRPRR
jgi:hypothetical protein